MQVYSAEEVAKHNTDKDAWVIVGGKVYNVTDFLSEHPGGKKILLKSTGKDATEQFKNFHDDAVLESVAKPFLIGVVGNDKSKL
ncbi:cytochrome b5-like heme/steroid binding domain-containing protein [Umbelopsis sp. PMI_123]|nr:cytochrome b5-like heme/steroid binding domain-containing protein [Umbelopsis sp. PMI_123]